MRQKEEQEELDQELAQCAEQAEITTSLLDTILSEVVASEPAHLPVAPSGDVRLGTSTTGDVRPASPAAAAPVVVGDKVVEDSPDEGGCSGEEGDDEDW